MRIHMLGGKAQERFFDHKPGDEVWGLNNCRFPWAREKYTRFFNLHLYENLVRYGYRIIDDVDYLQRHPYIAFYTLDRWPEFHPEMNVQTFPAHRLVTQWIRGTYHCGSFDWMLAFAIDTLRGLRGAPTREIVLHGVSLLIESGEPISARACLEYWCGIAEGEGMIVTCADDCDLFAFYHLVKSNLVYGLDDTPIYEDRTREPDGEPPYKIPERE